MGTEKSFPPAWFKIENYRGTKEFGPLEWYEQLCRRQALLRGYKLGEKVGSFYEDRLWRIHLAEEAKPMRQNPLEHVPLIGPAVPDARPVNDIRVMDLMRQADRDREAYKFGMCDKTATQRWRVIRNPQASYARHDRLSQQLLRLEFYDVRKPPRAVLQVDLGATDTVLRAAFDQWLAAARDREGMGGVTTNEAASARDAKLSDKARAEGDEDKTRESPYERFTRYGILPYIDLVIWAMETESRVNRPMYAQALHDGGHYRTHDNLKTTTELHAAQLMRDLSKLKAAVGYES